MLKLTDCQCAFAGDMICWQFFIQPEHLEFRTNLLVATKSLFLNRSVPAHLELVGYRGLCTGPALGLFKPDVKQVRTVLQS